MASPFSTTHRPKWLTDFDQPIPTATLDYANQGPMTNQRAQQFHTATGYMPNRTVGGNFGVSLPNQLAPAGFDASQRSKSLTARMLDPNMNADGRYFQGAQIGVGANGRPAWIDPAPVGDVAGMDARKRAIFERMEQQGKGYFDRRTGRFIGASGGTNTPSPAAMMTMGNDQAQRTAGMVGSVPQPRPGILAPDINGTVPSNPTAALLSPAPTATVPNRFAQFTPNPPGSPAGALLTPQLQAPPAQSSAAGQMLDPKAQRLQRAAIAQELVTARAQQRGSERRERLAGPDWQEVLMARNPQFALAMQRNQQLLEGERADRVLRGREIDVRERQAMAEVAAASAEKRAAYVAMRANAGATADEAMAEWNQMNAGNVGGNLLVPAGGFAGQQLAGGAIGSPAAAMPAHARPGSQMRYGVPLTPKQGERLEAAKDDPWEAADVLTKEFGLSKEQANVALNRMYPGLFNGGVLGATRTVDNPSWYGSWDNYFGGIKVDPATGQQITPPPRQQPAMGTAYGYGVGGGY